MTSLPSNPFFAHIEKNWGLRADYFLGVLRHLLFTLLPIVRDVISFADGGFSGASFQSVQGPAVLR